MLALGLSASAWLLVVMAGIPERAAYSGTLIEGVGYVAPETGALAPPLRVTTLTGDIFDSQQLAGRTLIINFWATWCIPCELELPLLQRVSEQHPHALLLAVNVGEGEETVSDWLAERQLMLPVALDPALTISRQYQVRGQPVTYIIAPDGRIRTIFFGVVSEDRLLAALSTDNG